MEKIEQNINVQNGTFIDWQYLEKAADSLAKVSFVIEIEIFYDDFIFQARYTLMYTYPYAYYQEDTVDRNLVR